LEPETLTIGEEDTSELDDMTRRVWICTVLTVPLLIYVMSGMFGVDFSQYGIPSQVLQWAELVLATLVVLWGAAPFFVRGWQSVKSRNLN
ncbi:copper-transporting ATPase, partial [Acinetobacter baumannii]